MSMVVAQQTRNRKLVARESNIGCRNKKFLKMFRDVFCFLVCFCNKFWVWGTSWETSKKKCLRIYVSLLTCLRMRSPLQRIHTKHIFAPNSWRTRLRWHATLHLWVLTLVVNTLLKNDPKPVKFDVNSRLFALEGMKGNIAGKLIETLTNIASFWT